MPLLKKRPFALVEPPQDLEPHDLVYQVRFTKEIFRNYQDYLNRVNLYRNGVWVSKFTGKTNFTYEEALVLEKRAAEKVQELPKELVAPALHIIQFSMLPLKDLAKTIATKLQDYMLVGAELYGKKEDDEPKEEPIRYPIDDLLVQPGADDPVFTDHPLSSRDLNVPMDCTGDLLMVWDFCSSFSRLPHLSPFSLEDFENAICHKVSNLTLIVESHASLFRLLINDTGENLIPFKNKKRKITVINWMEYLCGLLEIINIPELCSNMGTIKRGHYGLLDANTKLGILRELVNQALETDPIREKLDEHIEQR